MCDSCTFEIRRPVPTVPKYSIAAGVDFGNPERLGLGPLNLIEELLISQSRLYVSIVKLIGTKTSERQSAKRGHVITFPQPDGPAKLAELQRINSDNGDEYPRTENLSEFISVVFVGSRVQYKALVPSRFPDVRELRVRVEVVYRWLHALKQLNPLYRNVEIVETEAMSIVLEKITEELIENATLVENEADIMIDQLVTPEGSTDVPAEEVDQITEDSADQPLPASLLTRSIPLTHDKNKSVRTTFRTLLTTFGGKMNPLDEPGVDGERDDDTELPEQISNQVCLY